MNVRWKNTFDLLNVSRLDYNLGTVRIAPMELICTRALWLLIQWTGYSLQTTYITLLITFTLQCTRPPVGRWMTAITSTRKVKHDHTGACTTFISEPFIRPQQFIMISHMLYTIYRNPSLSLGELDQSMRILMPFAHNTIINIPRRAPRRQLLVAQTRLRHETTRRFRHQHTT